MKNGETRIVPINDIKTEPGADELIRSEKMKPYLALIKANMGGQDTQPYLAALAAVPLEDRYVWRVISALKWGFCDFDSQSARADLHTLSDRDLEIVAEPLAIRAIQFCLFVQALLGQNGMEQIMQQALRYAKDSSTPDQGK
jgi:hypothetical protein